MSSCSVIIKTHNSEKYLPKCVKSLLGQTRVPEQIIIVDSASRDTSYFQSFQNHELFKIKIVEEDIGFCRGNNLGYQYISPTTEFVLILNPDAFPTPAVIQDLIDFMDELKNARVGMVTGTLLGYDIEKEASTGRIDSTGIFRTWYGSWFDRRQSILTNDCKKVPAICGAFMFCRKQALDEVLIRGEEIFDNQFFMYKEDVDLSLRLRKRGWDLLWVPWVTIYHCRGWNSDRRKVPRKNRLLSARNDIRMDQKNYSPYFFLSLVKYFMVKVFNF